MKYTVQGDDYAVESIEPLQDIVNTLGYLNNILYQLESCRRTDSLVQIRDRVATYAQELLDHCVGIDDGDEIIEENE